MWGRHLQRSLRRGQGGREKTTGHRPWSPGLKPVLDHLRQPEVGLPLRRPVRQTTGLQRPTTTRPTMTMRKKNKEGDWEVWQDSPTRPFSRKTKSLSLLSLFSLHFARPGRLSQTYGCPERRSPTSHSQAAVPRNDVPTHRRLRHGRELDAYTVQA